MSSIVPLARTTPSFAPDPLEFSGLLGDPFLADELTADELPGETLTETAARHAAAADILTDLAPERRALTWILPDLGSVA